MQSQTVKLRILFSLGQNDRVCYPVVPLWHPVIFLGISCYANFCPCSSEISTIVMPLSGLWFKIPRENTGTFAGFAVGCTQGHTVDKGPVTRGDLSQWHVPVTTSHTCHTRGLVAVTSCCDSPQAFFPESAVTGKACHWFIYRLVASACHTRGQNERATFCRRDVSHEFKLIWIHATSRTVELHQNIHVTRGDLSPHLKHLQGSYTR